MTRRLTIVAGLALATLAAVPASAARHHDTTTGFNTITQFCGDRVCGSAAASTTPRKARRAHRAPADANGNRASTTTSRACLTAETRGLLEQAEAHFQARFTVVSTCRPGATIAGTSHPSLHRYGKAVDLLAPKHLKAAVVRWFYAHARGVTMTYAKQAHIHFDTGPYHKLACGGCRTSRARLAHLP